MSFVDLLTRADQAFAKQDNEGGLELLREYTVANPSDAGSWHRRAVVEEQIGDWAQAGECHYHCIQSAPSHSIAFLYSGSWLQQNGNTDAAAACYSIAQEANPHVLELWKNQQEAEPTRIKSKHADQLLRRYLSTQHRQLFDHSNSRLKDAVWVRSHDAALTHINDDFSPDLFFIPALTQKPFFEAEEFDWAETLCKQTQLIQNELESALSKHAEELGVRPYLAADLNAAPALQHLVGSPNWSAIDLYRNGELNAAAEDQFPDTLELIQMLPTYGLSDTPFEVFFSVLQPHNAIGEHFGQSNHSLTVHLGLDTPEGSYLSVVDNKRRWRDGELLIFDDSFRHSAHNTSDQQRIILLFSIWHPSLTDEERCDVQQTFKTRQQWLEARHGKLEQLRANTLS